MGLLCCRGFSQQAHAVELSGLQQPDSADNTPQLLGRQNCCRPTRPEEDAHEMHAGAGISVEQVIPMRRCRPTEGPEMQQPDSADNTPQLLGRQDLLQAHQAQRGCP